MHQKCSNYALINLLFGLCKSMWIIDPLVTRPSPHPKAPTRPSTPKMLRARECTPTPPSVVFTFGLLVESIKEFGDASLFMPSPPNNGYYLAIFLRGWLAQCKGHKVNWIKYAYNYTQLQMEKAMCPTLAFTNTTSPQVFKSTNSLLNSTYNGYSVSNDD
jgi:hypothetical protein